MHMSSIGCFGFLPFPLHVAAKVFQTVLENISRKPEVCGLNLLAAPTASKAVKAAYP